jgi:hypothetical protein
MVDLQLNLGGTRHKGQEGRPMRLSPLPRTRSELCASDELASAHLSSYTLHPTHMKWKQHDPRSGDDSIAHRPLAICASRARSNVMARSLAHIVNARITVPPARSLVQRPDRQNHPRTLQQTATEMPMSRNHSRERDVTQIPSPLCTLKATLTTSGLLSHPP